MANIIWWICLVCWFVMLALWFRSYMLFKRGRQEHQDRMFIYLLFMFICNFVQIFIRGYIS